MPITSPYTFQRISQDEFGEIAFEVMKHVFQIHDEYGRFFNETIFKRELANRIDIVHLEVPITVSFQSFAKIYYLDTMIGPGGLFEFKATDAIHQRHRAQAINYLLLADLEHAKVINTRPERVEHEFVNCTLRRNETRTPTIEIIDWDTSSDVANRFLGTLSSMFRDWGSALESGLYEDAIAQTIGAGPDRNDAIAVYGSNGQIGQHAMRLLDPITGFRVTAFQKQEQNFAVHCRRLLNHTDLQKLLWANLTAHNVTLTMIER